MSRSSLSDLEIHLSDLSRQVVILTREVALRDNPSLVQALEDERDGTNDGSMDSVISQNLVIFRSIPELQQQNQKLVKIVRELGRKLEAVEANGGRVVGQEDGSAAMGEEAMRMVDEANDLISALKAKLEAKSVQMDKALRERDMFSRMLSQAGVSLPAEGELAGGGAGGGGSLLDVVKANLDAYRVELGLDSERLRRELDETRREVGVLSGEIAKVSAERDWLKGEHIILHHCYFTPERIESLRSTQVESNTTPVTDACPFVPALLLPISKQNGLPPSTPLLIFKKSNLTARSNRRRRSRTTLPASILNYEWYVPS